MRDFNDQARPPPDHCKELSRLIEGVSNRHGQWQVFSDFAEMAAISISNAVDLRSREPREARYMEIIKRYQPGELARFPQMMGELVLALEDEPTDVLGKAFHELELHNKWAGQFFSPYPLCQMMAQMTLSDRDSIKAQITERGFIRASEPAAGSGAMVIALADAMSKMGINYQHHLHVTATDVDVKCVHMAYVQLSLLHIPAVIVHGNSLSLEEHAHWYTPAHIMGGWSAKLKRQFSAEHEVQSMPEDQPKPDTEAPVVPSTKPTQLTLF